MKKRETRERRERGTSRWRTYLMVRENIPAANIPDFIMQNPILIIINKSHMLIHNLK